MKKGENISQEDSMRKRKQKKKTAVLENWESKVGAQTKHQSEPL